MKNILKTLSLLIAFVIIAGTLTIQAAPTKIQLTPKDKHNTKIVILKEDPEIILYITENDQKEMESIKNNNKDIIKIKFIIEPKEAEAKQIFGNTFQSLTNTDFWAIGVSVELNKPKETMKIIDFQLYDEKGEIIIHVGDIYVKNYEEITMEQILDIAATTKK